MGPLGPVSLIVAAAVVALLVNLGSLAAQDDRIREGQALDPLGTSPPSSTRTWDERWQRAIGEDADGGRPLSLAETLLAVASGDLLPAVPGEDVVEEVETLVSEGVLATDVGFTSSAGGTSGPRFPGEEDVLSGASLPGSSPGPAPSDPSASDPDPTGPAAPSPIDPTPSDPAPTDPAPTDPTPSDPAPTDPAPTDPTPSDPQPEPSDPPPSDPPPSGEPTSEPDPEPTDPAPEPSDPAPTEPAP